MTQVKDYKIDIFPCHPSQLFIRLMEGLRVRISMIIQFVKVYGTLSNLRFIRSVFSSATRKQQRLSYSLSEQQRWPHVTECSSDGGKHYIHEISFIAALQGFSLKLAAISWLKTASVGICKFLSLLWRTCQVNNSITELNNNNIKCGDATFKMQCHRSSH